MRILGVSEEWDKLSNPEFTTFRFTRKDKDWQTGEFVQVVYKPRTKEREVLGIAEVIGKERRWVGWATTLVDYILYHRTYKHWLQATQAVLILFELVLGTVSHKEAVEDGFTGVLDMIRWMSKTHKDRNNREMMNKLTLRWLEA